MFRYINRTVCCWFSMFNCTDYKCLGNCIEYKCLIAQLQSPQLFYEVPFNWDDFFLPHNMCKWAGAYCLPQFLLWCIFIFQAVLFSLFNDCLIFKINQQLLSCHFLPSFKYGCGINIFASSMVRYRQCCGSGILDLVLFDPGIRNRFFRIPDTQPRFWWQFFGYVL